MIRNMDKDYGRQYLYTPLSSSEHGEEYEEPDKEQLLMRRHMYKGEEYFKLYGKDMRQSYVYHLPRWTLHIAYLRSYVRRRRS